MQGLLANLGFWLAVAIYLLFLLYLVLTPDRVAHWCRRVFGSWVSAPEEPLSEGYYYAGAGAGARGDPALRLAWRAQAAAEAAAAAAAAGEEVVVGEAPPTPFSREDQQLLSPRAVVYRVQGEALLRVAERVAVPFAGGRPSPSQWQRVQLGAEGGRSESRELEEPFLQGQPQPQESGGID